MHDAGVGIYDARSGQCLVEWDAFDTALVRFSRDGTRTLEGNVHHEVKVREASTGRILWSGRSVPCAVFTAAGDVITAFGQLRLLKGESGDTMRTLPPSRGAVMDMALSPDGGTLYVVTSGGEVRGTSMADGGIVFEGRLTAGDGPARIALGSGGKTIVAASARPDGLRTLRAWDATTGALIDTMLGSTGMI